MKMDQQKQFVQDLKEKDQIKSIFIATDKTVLVDRNGKKYLSINLRDSTGAINGRLWDRVEDVENVFTSGDFVWVKGHVQIYQNRRQVIIHDLRKADTAEVNFDNFINGTDRKIDDLWNDFIEFIHSIKNTHIAQLLKLTVNDEKNANQIKQAPAAKSIHHAYMGGLLEHIVSICQLMNFLASHYKNLDRDLLLFGAIFHDIGKIEELQLDAGIQYSSKGRLVGHMGIACEFIDKYSSQILGFPEELKNILKHIVLSHHGKLEYGSPKEPSFPEAIVVAMVDDLDSKLNTIFSFMEDELEGGESWTRYHQGFDRYFYLEIFKKMKEQ